MAKPRLVSNRPLTLHSDWLRPIVEPKFELLIKDDVAATDCYYTNHWDSTAIKHARQGGRVVIDRLWEAAGSVPRIFACHVLRNWSWFWYQESLWYRHLGYNAFQPKPNWTHHALMPLKRRRPSRDYLVEQLKTELDRFVWSYQDCGKHLPDGGDPSDWNSQRLFNPAWYNSTAMSLVAETAAESTHIWTNPFVTEKTFKPVAFRHPFVVAGQSGTLDFLHRLGFETFENLWDESYDQILDWRQRCDAVINNVLSYRPCAWDSITKQKLDHNHHRFFDQQLVTKLIQQEIIEPLLHYAET